jgi:hypothetical protein
VLACGDIHEAHAIAMAVLAENSMLTSVVAPWKDVASLRATVVKLKVLSP